MSVYYDRNGNPLGGMDDYIRAESLEGRRVARTFVGDVELSTVWLGIDHSFGLGDHILGPEHFRWARTSTGRRWAA